MCSSSPAGTPKLQLTIEQPLTGDCWIPPKKDSLRPPGPCAFSFRILLIFDSISLIEQGLFRLSVSPCVSFGTFNGIGLFHQIIKFVSIKLFAVFLGYPLNSHGISSDYASFIINICNLCLLSFSLGYLG